MKAQRSDKRQLQNPRFSEQAIADNIRLADAVAQVAQELQATPAQIALAWVLSRDLPVAAIPGTRRIDRLEQNWAAQTITLSAPQPQRLESLVNAGVTGARY